MNLIPRHKSQLLTLLKKIVPALILLPALAGFAAAQQTLDLSQCIKTGLERNFDIRVVRNQEQIATNNFTPGNAGYMPVLGLTNRFGGTVNTTNQSLREGGENTTEGIHNTSASSAVDLGMTIFRGFQVQTTYKKLNEVRQLGVLNTQMAMEDLVAGIASEYYYFVEQVSLSKNLAYAVLLSKERVRIDEQRYLLGSSSKMQLLQSIVYLNADSSRLARQKEVMRASQVRLNKLMASADMGNLIYLKDTLIAINQDLRYDELLQTTLDQNTSLKIASKNQIISELDYKIIASKAYPYLTASSGFALSGAGYEAGTLRNQNTRGLNYGLTLGVNIFDGFNRKRERSNALLDIENRQYRYQEVEQEVKADLITIYYAYENNLRLIKLEEQNLSVARENLEIALERYKLGSLSGLELREVQKSLLDAEERLISVKYMTKLAEISLLQISGQVMDYL